MSSDAETFDWELIWAWVSPEYSVGEVDSLWLRTPGGVCLGLL